MNITRIAAVAAVPTLGIVLGAVGARLLTGDPITEAENVGRPR